MAQVVPCSVRRFNRTLALTVMLAGTVLAQTTPIQGVSDTIDQGVGTINTAFDKVQSTYTSIDSAIAMLTKLIPIASAFPIIGPLAQTLVPVLNSYLDYKGTLQPIFDAMQRGRESMAKMVGIKDSVKNLFSSTNFNDSVNNINSLVTQFGGLPNLTKRSVSASNTRADVAKILAAADAKIAITQQAANAARSAGDIGAYRHYLGLADELTRLRQRIQMAGETAAGQQDNAKVMARTTSTAEQVAHDSESHGAALQSVQSAEGAMKVLGTIALDQANTTAQGFQALSQQLTTISKLQTVTNEQNDQLLQHYQAEDRQRLAQLRQAVEEQQANREEQYQSMVKKASTLSDAISQTLIPNDARSSDMSTLMQGKLR